MLFKVSIASTLLWKCLTVQGGRSVALATSVTGTPSSFALNNVSHRDFMTNPISSATDTPTPITSLTPPPKRAPNVFALFVKDNFKKLPAGMPVKEKFSRTAEEWRGLSDDQKDELKRGYADAWVQYKQRATSFFETMSTEELAEFKKLKKEKIREKTRRRIRKNLTKLNYPKRPISGYLFYIRDNLKEKYTDGKYPSVRSPEHIRSVGMWAQRWRNMNADERKPFLDMAEKDRARYYAELEEWKVNLAKPENEADLLELERLSRKAENTHRSDEEVKKRQRKAAAKVIRARVAKKAAKEGKSAKKKTTPKKKATTDATDTTTTKVKKGKKTAKLGDEHDEEQ